MRYFKICKSCACSLGWSHARFMTVFSLKSISLSSLSRLQVKARSFIALIYLPIRNLAIILYTYTFFYKYKLFSDWASIMLWCFYCSIIIDLLFSSPNLSLDMLMKKMWCTSKTRAPTTTPPSAWWLISPLF